MAELLAVLVRIMDTAEREETQLRAAVEVLNRLEGPPVARAVTVNAVDPATITDAELLAIIAAEDGGGGAAPDDDPL